MALGCRSALVLAAVALLSTGCAGARPGAVVNSQVVTGIRTSVIPPGGVLYTSYKAPVTTKFEGTRELARKRGEAVVRQIALPPDVLRLRAPLLRSEEFTHGPVQPFLSAGPALFVTWAGQNRNVQPHGQNGTDVTLGAKASAGFTFQLTQRIGLFTEYRYTHFTSKLSYQNTTPSPATESYEATYDSHHIIGGLSFTFP